MHQPRNRAITCPVHPSTDAAANSPSDQPTKANTYTVKQTNNQESKHKQATKGTHIEESHKHKLNQANYHHAHKAPHVHHCHLIWQAGLLAHPPWPQARRKISESRGAAAKASPSSAVHLCLFRKQRLQKMPSLLAKWPKTRTPKGSPKYNK